MNHRERNMLISKPIHFRGTLICGAFVGTALHSEINLARPRRTKESSPEMAG
jgi:hypothetical protein